MGLDVAGVIHHHFVMDGLEQEVDVMRSGKKGMENGTANGTVADRT